MPVYKGLSRAGIMPIANPVVAPAVKVKWGKENYPNVELDTDELPILFKAQLFALTGVQPERQKVMVKGKIVNEETWQGLPVKDVSKRLTSDSDLTGRRVRAGGTAAAGRSGGRAATSTAGTGPIRGGHDRE